MTQPVLLAVLGSSSLDGLAQDVAQALGGVRLEIVHGSGEEAARMLHAAQISPRYVLIDLAQRRDSALTEIDALGSACEPGTSVVGIGEINDIHFYRQVTARGIGEYLPAPVVTGEVIRAFLAQQERVSAPSSQGPAGGDVFAFLSAAGGDGSSTAALNAAHSIALQTRSPTVLVDLDYQFGTAVRNLNLSPQYGMRDIFEHADLEVDETLIKRVVVDYGPLHIISAPQDLRFVPPIDPRHISDLVRTLRQSYKTVVLDLPHVWNPWVAAACRESGTLVMVAQLWLKSVTHGTRLLRACRDNNALPANVRMVINRSGAKFKEGVEPKDFEKVTGFPIAHSLSNDIKTVVDAENQACTIMDLTIPSRLQTDLDNLARMLKGGAVLRSAPVEDRPSLATLFRKPR